MKQSWTAGMRGLAAGVLVGLSLGGLLALAGGFLYVRRETRALSQVWQPVEVVTAAVEVPAGTLLTPALLTTGWLPQQAATRSVVRPEALSEVLGRRVAVPLQPGDALLWTQVCAEGAECPGQMGVRPAVGTVGGGTRPQVTPAGGRAGALAP